MPPSLDETAAAAASKLICLAATIAYNLAVTTSSFLFCSSFVVFNGSLKQLLPDFCHD